MNCLLVLSLAVLGASAAPCGLNFNVVPGCAPALQGRTILAQTPVIENPTSVFPTVLPTTSVSESCHCFKSTVRPQLRNEIITVPTVDRIVRIVNSPVVETVSVNLGGNTRNYQVPTCAGVEGIVSPVSGLVGGVSGVSGIVGGVSGVSGLVGGVSGVSGVVGGVSGVSGLVGGVSGVSGIVSPVATQVIGGNYGLNSIVGTNGCGSNVVV